MLDNKSKIKEIENKFQKRVITDDFNPNRKYAILESDLEFLIEQAKKAIEFQEKDK